MLTVSVQLPNSDHIHSVTYASFPSLEGSERKGGIALSTHIERVYNPSVDYSGSGSQEVVLLVR